MAPRVDSLSRHVVPQGDGEQVFVHGDGFRQVTSVWFGDQWSRDYRVDGETVITATVPHLEPGRYHVVVRTLEDGDSEPTTSSVLEVTAGAEPVVAGLRLDSITPDAIALGRSAAYWVGGAGMLGVSAVMLGASACTFEAYDDTRLVVTVPEHVREVSPGAVTDLWVYPRSGDALSLRVQTYDAAPQEPATTGSFSVWAVSPDHVPPSGGRVALEGDGFDAGTRVLVGDAECTVVEVARGRVAVDVPALWGSEGQTLPVTVLNGEAVASNASSVGIRVEG